MRFLTVLAGSLYLLVYYVNPASGQDKFKWEYPSREKPMRRELSEPLEFGVKEPKPGQKAPLVKPRVKLPVKPKIVVKEKVVVKPIELPVSKPFKLSPLRILIPAPVEPPKVTVPEVKERPKIYDDILIAVKYLWILLFSAVVIALTGLTGCKSGNKGK